jgi:CRISPR-associated protein Cas5h
MAPRRETLPIVTFRYRAKFGHFLRAEASVSALTYPVPPRTALLGMIGAVLGLPKDAPQVELRDSLIAVSGRVPQTHWHRVKLRKDPPAPLPRKVKKGAKGSSSPEKATLIKQEWLFEPDYTITASLPEKYHKVFAERLRDRRWHYSPCMGLSEMIASLEFLSEGEAIRLPPGSEIMCSTVSRKDEVSVDGNRALETSSSGTPLAILPLRMPREVTPERIFTHADYLIERSGQPIPLQTDNAWQTTTLNNEYPVIFL